MVNIDFVPMPGKNNKQNFLETLAQQRHHNRAQKALYDIIVFNEMLEEEIRELNIKASQGKPVDKELLGKMMSIREKYDSVMYGLENYDDKAEHLALIMYADAVQDLMNHLNKNKRH